MPRKLTNVWYTSTWMRSMLKWSRKGFQSWKENRLQLSRYSHPGLIHLMLLSQGLAGLQPWNAAECCTFGKRDYRLETNQVKIVGNQYNPFGDLETMRPEDNRVFKTHDGSLIAVSYEARPYGVKRWGHSPLYQHCNTVAASRPPFNFHVFVPDHSQIIRCIGCLRLLEPFT